MWTKTFLLALWIVNAISLFGYATFALHPQYLTLVPYFPDIFQAAYPLFARLQIFFSFFAMAAALSEKSGRRWLPAFAGAAGLSLVSELCGTKLGLPFGKYAYTSLLGPKIFDAVPYLIPTSWFFMAVPSYVLVRRASLRRSRLSLRIERILLASLLLLAWDLVLDPAMSRLTPFWLWENPGPYYGMPYSNLLGWYVTGMVIMAWFEVCHADEVFHLIADRWYLSFYAANLFLPLGMVVAASMWGAFGVTAMLLALIATMILQINRREVPLYSATVS